MSAGPPPSWLGMSFLQASCPYTAQQRWITTSELAFRQLGGLFVAACCISTSSHFRLSIHFAQVFNNVTGWTQTCQKGDTQLATDHLGCQQ